MKLISHRGNINGKTGYENQRSYILNALRLGFEVEIDVWFDKKWYLGHDAPTFAVDIFFLKTHGLWLHAKHLSALVELSETNLNYYYHERDNFTLTSNKLIWTYPGLPLTSKSIAVLPELHSYTQEDLSAAYGICSDFIEKYKNA